MTVELDSDRFTVAKRGLISKEHHGAGIDHLGHKSLEVHRRPRTLVHDLTLREATTDEACMASTVLVPPSDVP